MFDYFFKRSATPKPASTPVAVPEVVVAVAPPVREKELALQAAQALSEEAAAVEFILQCQFADARLIAVEHVNSKAMLERLFPAMRNADRRVAKLIQARLDTLVFAQQCEQQAQQCVEQARSLATEQFLLPNRVADIDHAWELLGAPSDVVRQEFDSIRSVLRERLSAQAQLQRAVIDSLAALRDLSSQAVDLKQAEVLSTLERIEQHMAQHLASPEAPSLPKNLLSDFSTEHQQFKLALSSLELLHQASEAMQALLQSWEQEGALADLTAQSMKQAWKALPALPPSIGTIAVEDFQLRFDTLLKSLTVSREEAPATPKEEAVAEFAPVDKVNVAEQLEAMHNALEDGTVRAALEIDKQLRALEQQRVRFSSAQTAQLSKMRSELNRLQGWAKWGGNISREELLKAAEDLPAKNLAVIELAKRIGGLRDRWKSLDVSAGPANKELWLRFDAACTLAYAPAAAHFKKLADERQANLRKAEAIVTEVKEFVLSSNCAADNDIVVDWKAVAAFSLQTTQAWQRLGSIDRKDKKRLDGEFEQSLQLLKTPLAAQQQAEAALREKLITETLALNPLDRSTLDNLRGLQERWQQRAKTLPLERKVEQALWQKFRAACDGLFAKRKEVAASADAERKSHLQEKQDLCAALEAAITEPGSAIVKILRDSKDVWNKIGPVPRAVEAQIEARFQSASTALQHQLEQAKRVAASAELEALSSKLQLCQTLERELAGSPQSGITLAQWQALPVLSGEVERVLRKRFDQALAAIDHGDAQYAITLEKNREQLLSLLLRLEIVTGVESPAELSRERLQMQVTVLQTTLKSGPVANKQNALLDLYKLAALVDQATAERIERVVRKSH